MEKGISQKETAILNAVMCLVKKGTPPHLVKVADVAREAGIGKGTVYVYFSSKEELLIRAFSFTIGRMVETLLAEFREAPNFREGMMKVFDFLIECDCRSFSLFHFCDTEMLALAHHRLFDQIYHSYFDTILDCLDRIVSRGVDEGAFPPPISTSYGRYVLIAAFSGFHTTLTARTMAGDQSFPVSELKEFAYKSLRRSLTPEEKSVESSREGQLDL